MSHLDALENNSIFILREAHQAFRNVAMPWSMGKDSNVLIWLARKSFLGQNPVHHCISIRPMNFLKCWKFRDWAIKHYNFHLIVGINTETRERRIG